MSDTKLTRLPGHGTVGEVVQTRERMINLFGRGRNGSKSPLPQSIKQKEIARLENLRRTVKKQEDRAYARLNVSSIEELQKKIDKLGNSGLINLIKGPKSKSLAQALTAGFDVLGFLEDKLEQLVLESLDGSKTADELKNSGLDYFIDVLNATIDKADNLEIAHFRKKGAVREGVSRFFTIEFKENPKDPKGVDVTLEIKDSSIGADYRNRLIKLLDVNTKNLVKANNNNNGIIEEQRELWRNAILKYADITDQNVQNAINNEIDRLIGSYNIGLNDTDYGKKIQKVYGALNEIYVAVIMNYLGVPGEKVSKYFATPFGMKKGDTGKDSPVDIALRKIGGVQVKHYDITKDVNENDITIYPTEHSNFKRFLNNIEFSSYIKPVRDFLISYAYNKPNPHYARKNNGKYEQYCAIYNTFSDILFSFENSLESIGLERIDKLIRIDQKDMFAGELEEKGIKNNIFYVIQDRIIPSSKIIQATIDAINDSSNNIEFSSFLASTDEYITGDFKNSGFNWPGTGFTPADDTILTKYTHVDFQIKLNLSQILLY